MDFIEKTMKESHSKFQEAFKGPSSASNLESKIEKSISSAESKLPSIPTLQSASTVAKSPARETESSEKNVLDDGKTLLGEKLPNEISIFFTTHWLTMLFWGGIILLIAFLGINVFKYLSDFTDFVTKIFKPLVTSVTNLMGDVSKQTINVSATGTKGIIDTAASTTTGGIDLLQKQINSTGASDSKSTDSTKSVKSTDSTKSVKSTDSTKSTKSDTSDTSDKTSKSDDTTEVTKASDDTDVSTIQDSNDYDVAEVSDPMPFVQDTTVQSNTVSGKGGKSGYCYIGTENGIRTCAKVGKNNICMSEEIFPTRAVCMNPKLRA